MSRIGKNLLNLSKFTQKAKKHFGSVKSAEILNNESYANEIFINSILYGDRELVEFSKLILDEVNSDRNLICSVETYINSISTKDLSSERLHKRKYFIVKLTKHLIGIEINGTSYRNAVEQLLKLIDMKDRTYCIYLAREFYPFWRNAYKLHNESTLKSENTELDALIELWGNIETEIFSDYENWPLSVYIDSMKQVNVSEKEIKIRTKIAKLITLKLRASNDNLTTDYRTAVKKLEPLFANQNLKDFYLIVSREFYRFWVGDFPKTSTV